MSMPPSSFSNPRMPPPHPDGWFALCFAHELKPGDVRTVRFMGRELVLYRTHAGQARVVAPYCPHLGAHLGRGGRVDGECLVCPFHGFAYGEDGRCVRTGSGQPPPRAAAIDFLPMRETAGMVCIWHHHAGAAPSWEPPALDLAGFSRSRNLTLQMHGHLQDMAENAGDSIHLRFVHGLGSHYQFAPPVADGHKLTGELNNMFGLGMAFRFTFHGLGLFIGEGEFPRFGLEVKLLIAATTREPMAWTFQHEILIRLSRPRLAPAAVRRATSRLLAMLAHGWAHKNVLADAPIWNHRAYLQRPALGADDVYVARVLRWCRQFYPQRAEDGIRNGTTPEPAASALDLRRADAAAGGRSPLETTIDEAWEPRHGQLNR